MLSRVDVTLLLCVFLPCVLSRLSVACGTVDPNNPLPLLPPSSNEGGIGTGLPALKYRIQNQQLTRILQKLQPIPKGGGPLPGKMRMRRSGLTTVMEQPFAPQPDVFNPPAVGYGTPMAMPTPVDAQSVSGSSLMTSYGTY
jgi:hypothetical protein